MIQGLAVIKTQVEHWQSGKFTWKGNLGSGDVCNLFRGALKNIRKSTRPFGIENIYFCNDFICSHTWLMLLFSLDACFLRHSFASQTFERLLCDRHWDRMINKINSFPAFAELTG